MNEIDILQKMTEYATEADKKLHEAVKQYDIEQWKKEYRSENLSDTRIIEELVAEFTGDLYSIETVADMFADVPTTTLGRIKKQLRNVISDFTRASSATDIAGLAKIDRAMGIAINRQAEIVNDWNNAVRAGTNKKAATGEGDGVVKTDYKKAKTNTGIYEGMSDAERYEILKDKQLTVVNTEGFVLDGELLEKIKIQKKSQANKMFRELAEKLGIIKKYSTKDIDFEFNFSKKNAGESSNKTSRSNHVSLAKAFHYFEDIVDNAVLIEAHENNEKHDVDTSLLLVYELISGYNTEDGFVPVKFTVKDFTGKDSILYAVTVYQTIKKADIVTQTSTSQSGQNSAPSASIFSLAEIFRNVNKEDSLYQYIPPQFFEGERYSYGGTRAAYDPDTFLQADRMRDFNYSDEEIRKATGWFKGADGEWRFEIDDSKMQVDFNGRNHRNPYIRKYFNLLDEIYMSEDYDESKTDKKKLDELNSLEEMLKDVDKSPKRLGDIIYHPDLFLYYPELEELPVVFKDLPGGTLGRVIDNRIELDRSLRLDTKKRKKTLIHEIQHTIQMIEGFAGGANVEYWRGKGKQADLQRANRALKTAENNYKKKYSKWPKDFQNLADEMYSNESWVENRDSEKIKRLYEKAETLYPDEFDEYFDLSWDLFKAYDRLKNVNREDYKPTFDEYDNYLFTAGEQEARDVQKRLDYTAEQRKSEKPFSGDDNTVYVEGISDNTYSASISEHIIGPSGKDYGRGVYLDGEYLDGLNEADQKIMVVERLKELSENTITAYDNNNNPVKIRIIASGYYKNRNSKRVSVRKDLVGKNANSVKWESLVLADELIETSNFSHTSDSKYSHGFIDNYGNNNWDYRWVYIQEKNGSVWEATLNVANSINGEKILYDIYPKKGRASRRIGYNLYQKQHTTIREVCQR